jgi:WD40 repeat protein
MRVLKTAPNEVLDVAFSPDCRAVAAAVGRAGIFLWNLDSPNIAAVRLEVSGKYRRGGLAFSPDGRGLGWLEAHARRAYDRDTRTTAALEYPLSAPVIDHSTDATGGRAVSNHNLPHHCLIGWRWVGTEWVRQWQLSTRDLSVSSLTLAPGGDRFAMLTRVTDEGRWWEQPMRFEVRDAATAAELSTGAYPYSYAKVLAFHPGGEQVAGINDMTLLAWPLPAGGDPRLVRNDSRKHFTALAYHPSGDRLFATSNDTTVHAFDARSLDRVSRYTWHLDRLSSVAVSPDGTLAAAGSATGDVVVWDLE